MNAPGIRDLQRLYHGFWLTGPVGNNAFSWEQRRQQQLWVPELLSGTAADVQLGDQPVFSEVEDGQEINRTGLRHWIYWQRGHQHIFIFDNHNHAFTFWYWAWQHCILRPGQLPLLHFDQHRDTRQPPEPFALKGSSLSDAFAYTNHILNVGNFILPAYELGWFTHIDQRIDTTSLAKPLPEALVLDLDLDLFAPEMDYLTREQRYTPIRQAIPRASLITIATSPYFLKQATALHHLHALFS